MTMDKNWVDDVIRFWFEELSPAAWFSGNAHLDDNIRTRFLSLYEDVSDRAERIPLSTGRDVLAAVIVLDQFPRNLFRGNWRAFATDAIALKLAQQAIAAGLDQELTPPQRMFLYMPFQHAEDVKTQARSIELFTSIEDGLGKLLGGKSTLDFARRHQAVIEQFGRFPHRNAALGRASSAEEQEYIQHNPGF